MVDRCSQKGKISIAIAAVVLLISAKSALADSVLDRILSNASAVDPKVYQSRGATQLFSNIAVNEGRKGNGTSADGSIHIEFERGLTALLAETDSGGVISRSFQKLTGRVGDLTSTVLGASLNKSSSIDLRFASGVRFTDKVETLGGYNLSIQTVGVNAAQNRMQLDGSISVASNGYTVDTKDVSTNVIGASSGGNIQFEVRLP